jgi:hypothetical protein
MSKRTLDDFFIAPVAKTPRASPETSPSASCEFVKTSNQPTYPWSLPHLPSHIIEELELLVSAEGKVMNNQPDLDLLYFQPFIPHAIERSLFELLRSELFFLPRHVRHQALGN